MTNKLQLFQGTTIRTVWDSEKEEWFFSVVDVCNVLSGSQAKDPGTYWRKLKQRLKAEGSEIVTNCHGLKLQAADGHPQIKINIDSLSRCFFCHICALCKKSHFYLCISFFCSNFARKIACIWEANQCSIININHKTTKNYGKYSRHSSVRGENL